MGIARDLFNPSHAIYNAVKNPGEGLAGTFQNSGLAGQILNPAAYAFANKRPGSSTFGAGGPVNTALDPADLFGGQKAFTSAQANTFNPNAPGSIFANRQFGGPPPNMPAPGTPTNGLAGGAQSGGIDWAPIIARALRKS